MLNEKPELMFTEITWAMYLRILAAALFIYYTVLLLKFYFPKMRASIPGWKVNFGADINAVEPNATSAIMSERGNLTPKGEFNEPGFSDYEIIEEMVERVKGSLKEAAEHRLTDDLVIPRLKAIVGDYPVLGKSSFRPSINEFLATESQQHGFTTITEETVEHLWSRI